MMFLQQAVLLYPGVVSEIIRSTVQDSLATSIFSLLFSLTVYTFSTAKNSTLLGGNAALMAGISSQIHFHKMILLVSLQKQNTHFSFNSYICIFLNKMESVTGFSSQ